MLMPQWNGLHRGRGEGIDRFFFKSGINKFCQKKLKSLQTIYDILRAVIWNMIRDMVPLGVLCLHGVRMIMQGQMMENAKSCGTIQ